MPFGQGLMIQHESDVRHTDAYPQLMTGGAYPDEPAGEKWSGARPGGCRRRAGRPVSLLARAAVPWRYWPARPSRSSSDSASASASGSMCSANSAASALCAASASLTARIATPGG